MDIENEISSFNTILSIHEILKVYKIDYRTLKDKVIQLNLINDNQYKTLMDGSTQIKQHLLSRNTKYIEILCFILKEDFIINKYDFLLRNIDSNFCSYVLFLLESCFDIKNDNLQLPKTCDTCFEVSIIHIHTCRNCKTNICYTCIALSDNYTCWKCKINLSLWCLKGIHDKSDLYKRYYVESIIQKYKNINFISLRYELLMNLDKDDMFHNIDTNITKCIMLCKKINCIGKVYEDYQCKICLNIHCKICHEIIENTETHICDKDIIDNLEFIKQNTKKCPSCFISIEKISATCNDMICVHCETYFNWRTLEKDKGPNSNKHYAHLLVKTKEMDNICLFNQFSNNFVYHYIYNDKDENNFLLINASNVFYRYTKKKIIWEYKYITETNKDTKIKYLYKLFDIYQILEFCNIIFAMQFHYLENITLYNNFNIFCPKINLLKNCKILFSINKPYVKIDDYKTTFEKINLKYYYTKNINQKEVKLPIDNNIYKYLDKFSLYITKHANKDVILGTLATQMEQVVIVSSKLSLMQWKNYSHQHNMKEIHVPKHLLSNINKNPFYFFDKNKHGFNVFDSYNRCVLVENFLQIISLDNTCIIIDIKTETITQYEKLFYSLLILQCLKKKIPIIIIYNIFNFENYFMTYYSFLHYFPMNIIVSKERKQDIIEFYKSILIEEDKNNVQYYKEYFINTTNTKILSHSPHRYHPSPRQVYDHFLIYKDDNYLIFRYSDKFDIYKNKKRIKHDHKICLKYKKCVFCVTCCEAINYNHRIHNNTGISMCCYIHGASYMNIETYNNIEFNLHTAIRYFNLSNYEINLLTKHYSSLYMVILHYIYHKSHNNTTIISKSNIKYKYFDIIKPEQQTIDILDIYHIQHHVLPIHIHIKDDLQREIMFTKYILNDIYKVLDNPLYEYKKFVLILYFKKSIKYAKDILKDKNILFIDINTSNNNKICTFNKFNNTANKLLILSSSVELPENNNLSEINDKNLIEVIYLYKNNINVHNYNHIQIDKIINMFNNINQMYNITYTEYKARNIHI